MTSTRACVSSFIAILLAVTAAAAAGQSPVTLTLDEAIAQGLANSFRLAELEARQDSAEAVEQGRAATSTSS